MLRSYCAGCNTTSCSDSSGPCQWTCSSCPAGNGCGSSGDYSATNAHIVRAADWTWKVVVWYVLLVTLVGGVGFAVKRQLDKQNPPAKLPYSTCSTFGLVNLATGYLEEPSLTAPVSCTDYMRSAHELGGALHGNQAVISKNTRIMLLVTNLLLILSLSVVFRSIVEGTTQVTCFDTTPGGGQFHDLAPC